MRIIEKVNVNSVSELHAMTRAYGIEKMETLVGNDIEFIAYVLFVDTKVDEESGEVSETEVLSVNVGGKVYATVSKTFIEEFKAIAVMCDEFGEPFSHVIVQQGTSKKGRKFITCAI